MQEELKPCPFCGSPAKMESDEEEWGFAVSCSNIDCPVDATTYARSTAEEAIEAWNTRAKNTCTCVTDTIEMNTFLKTDEIVDCHCSNCDSRELEFGFNYCPACGAKVVE